MVSDIISRKRFATERHELHLAAAEPLHELAAGGGHRLHRLREDRDRVLEHRVLLVLGDERGDVLAERLDVRAAALHQLAADEVHRLDVVGALVDREDLRVAAVLLDRLVREEAGAAVDLDRGRADLERLVASRTP